MPSLADLPNRLSSYVELVRTQIRHDLGGSLSAYGVPYIYSVMAAAMQVYNTAEWSQEDTTK